MSVYEDKFDSGRKNVGILDLCFWTSQSMLLYMLIITVLLFCVKFFYLYRSEPLGVERHRIFNNNNDNNILLQASLC